VLALTAGGEHGDRGLGDLGIRNPVATNGLLDVFFPDRVGYWIAVQASSGIAAIAARMCLFIRPDGLRRRPLVLLGIAQRPRLVRHEVGSRHEGGAVDRRDADRVSFWLVNDLLPAVLDWYTENPEKPHQAIESALRGLPQPPAWQLNYGRAYQDLADGGAFDEPS